MRVARAVVGLVLVGACGKEQAAGTPEGPCQDDAAFFREQVYPEVVQGVCMGCHTADGAARESGLVFVGPGNADHEARNRATLADLAGLERDGRSIVLLKPLGQEAHGGGEVLQEDDARYELLVDFVGRLETPVTCPGGDDDVDGDAGLVFATPAETLRKATVLMAGRLPTASEDASVRAGGDAALVPALWALMEESTFSTVFKERLNDLLLTDRYLLGSDGLGIVDEDRFPGTYWFEDAENDDELRWRANQAIAREPLELAAFVMREGRPWTDVIAADYTVVNDYSAMSYGLPGTQFPDPRDPASDVFREAQLPGWPHAGMLTTPAWLNRYPTTDTNRNRHRAWAVYKTFLATDILTFGDRPIDSTISDAHNPTLNDPQCTVCHATLDPVAGAFQSWDAEGRLAPIEEGWYAEMASPGFEGDPVPSSARTAELSWLAGHLVEDPRFAVASVHLVLRMFTGIDPLSAADVGGDEVKAAALAAQDAWVRLVADEFVARGYDIRYVVEQVVLSRYFRAVGTDGSAGEGALLHAGTAHLLTPEELDRKVSATTGIPWNGWAGEAPYLLGRYRMLYGGIDSFGVTSRLDDPNGVIASIAERMANEVACHSVAHDFVLDPAQRRLFPHVERTFVPITPDGFEVPGAEEAIRENIRWLHLRLLGEELAASDPELEETYALWFDVWTMGRAGIAAGTVDDELPWECMAVYDPYSGDSLPEAIRIGRDADYTVRAWTAVTAYLLSDYRFLFE